MNSYPRSHALYLLLMLTLCFTAIGSLPASAEDKIGVYNRFKELDIDNWAKPPIKFGSFLLFNDITINERYIDNVFARNDTIKSDFVTSIAPDIQLTKSYGKHDFAIALKGDARIHKNIEDENQLNYVAKALANFELRHDLNMPVTLSMAQETINRGELSQLSVFSREPESIQNKKAEIGLIYKPGRLQIDLIGSYLQKRVPDGDTAIPGNGITTISKDLDKDVTRIIGEVSYETGSKWKPLVRLEHTQNKYLRRLLTATGFDGRIQDNQSTRAYAGFLVDHKDLIQGRVLLGHEWRTYDEPGADDVQGFSAEIGLKIKPTKRLKAGLAISSKNTEDNLILTGVKQDLIEIRAEQELNSRLSALIDGSYRRTEFTSINREDKDYSAGAMLRYKLKRGFAIEGGYRHNTRTSTDGRVDYDQNVFTIGIQKQF